MKLATTTKLPKKTSAKVNDPDNPAWTQDMLGAPVLKRGRGPQANPTKAEYDLFKLKSRKNPYSSRLKKPVTMRLSEDVVEYFKAMADEPGVPYQSLIKLYLRDCLANSRKVQIQWPETA
ncbi:BrnA antitoxin family protein [Polaromonas sp. DSR2-3-2]|uniref:BrnA antitoxin family protein n=1 Tax=unclassified Polaromonas TaxID=2638319 RepID=UPI003CF8DA94